MLILSECLLVKAYVITRGGRASSDAGISTGHIAQGTECFEDITRASVTVNT